MSETVPETVPDPALARQRQSAQKRRNLVLAVGLVAFAVLIGLVTGVRLSEATHREAATRAAEAASSAKVQP